MLLSNVLLQVCGSISAYKAAYLASLLVKRNFKVKVILTVSARNFIGASTFFGLTKENPIENTTFTSEYPHAHIDLAKWADLILLYPASANTINRLANGLAEDLIGATFLANNFRKPYWIAPAMNEHMLINPITTESLKYLHNLGASIFRGDNGDLACGDRGQGRLIEPDQLLERINHL
jgi:phosphopantothenoylcysteine decarboxylase/phosphopantothenate--cysteine ligase